MESTAMADALIEATALAGGEAPDFMLISLRDFFILRGVFGINPWRLRIDMRRFRTSFAERRLIMRDWRYAHPALRHLCAYG